MKYAIKPDTNLFFQFSLSDMENNKTPNEVTRAIAGLKKDLTSTSTISSKKLAERTLTYLEESIAHIHKNKPETNLKSLLKLVQEHSDALQVAASRIVKDDSGTFKVIIKNLTMRILKILRSDLGDDEGEDLYGKVVKLVVKIVIKPKTHQKHQKMEK